MSKRQFFIKFKYFTCKDYFFKLKTLLNFFFNATVVSLRRYIYAQNVNMLDRQCILGRPTYVESLLFCRCAFLPKGALAARRAHPRHK